jgi:hypothetical protein
MIFIVDLVAKNSKARNFGAKCVSDDSVVIRLSKTTLNGILHEQEKRRPALIQTEPNTPQPEDSGSCKYYLYYMRSA